MLTGGFCWPGKSGLTGHVTRLLTGPGTCGMCPWCPQSLGRRDTSGVGSAAVPYQHTAALCGFRDGDARLAVPGGASSGISPIFLASDGFGCPSIRLRCVSFSSLLNNHRKGNSILSVLPHLTCPHVSLAFCPPLHFLAGAPGHKWKLCHRLLAPESPWNHWHRARSSCGVSFTLCCVGICLLWFSIEGLGKYSWKNSISSRHLQLLRLRQVGPGSHTVLCFSFIIWAVLPGGRS